MGILTTRKTLCRYPEELGQAKAALTLAQARLLGATASMTRAQIQALMRHIRPLHRIKTFSSLIDATDRLLGVAEDIAPGSREKMQPWVREYRRVLDRVRAQEQLRAAEHPYEAPVRPSGGRKERAHTRSESIEDAAAAH